jgi:RimJ/RimL family protein N-acetyltransferase
VESQKHCCFEIDWSAISTFIAVVNDTVNSLGQPVGFDLVDWKPPPVPPRTPMVGRFCRLEPLERDIHSKPLYDAYALDQEGRMWTYLPYGPFPSFETFSTWMKETCFGSDPLFFAIIDPLSGKPIGMASFMRITPAAGSIEVGHVVYSPLLQKATAATEAMYLMMKRAFELGYRRYEWKCDSLNDKSRMAAERLGFSFEGTFRQATVYKNRNRDTVWYSVIDREWPDLEKAFLRWLAPENFDERGVQKVSLSSLTRSARKNSS